MRILCIENTSNGLMTGSINITIGKWYEGIGITDTSEYYVLEDDSSFVTLYAKYNFTTLDELRNSRLNNIGIV
jgi:hypothetical protein